MLEPLLNDTYNTTSSITSNFHNNHDNSIIKQIIAVWLKGSRDGAQFAGNPRLMALRGHAAPYQGRDEQKERQRWIPFGDRPLNLERRGED